MDQFEILKDKSHILISQTGKSGALDSETSKEIMALFKQLNHDNETTIIIVTHDPNVGAQADRLVHILDGRLTEDVDHSRNKYLRIDHPKIQ